MNTIKLSIVTPNGMIFDGDVKSVTLPGKEGEFGVLPGHASLLSSLSVGVIVIEKAEQSEAVAINWGYAKVSASNVDVLVDGAVSLTPSSDSQTTQNIDKAKELIRSAKDSNSHLALVESQINSFA